MLEMVFKYRMKWNEINVKLLTSSVLRNKLNNLNILKIDNGVVVNDIKKQLNEVGSEP